MRLRRDRKQSTSEPTTETGRGRTQGRKQRRRVPAALAGAIVLVLIAGVFILATQRHRIAAELKAGHIVEAQFSRQYLVLKYRTEVKVAGVPIGIVLNDHHDADGMLVDMKVFGHNDRVLGTAPTAAIRINTLLGGIVYIQLTPGGSSGTPVSPIPLKHTTVPVYVDSILSSVPPPAQSGIKKFINQSNTTLQNGGEAALTKTLAAGPGALTPSKEVLEAVQGDLPGDLTNLVAYLGDTAKTLTAKEGQLESVVDSLGNFSTTLGNESNALATTVAGLPSELDQANSGLTALDTTLDDLDATAAVARPSVEQLDGLITSSLPTLVAAKPVLDRLDPLLEKLNPVLSQLVPTSTKLTTVLDGVKGPVINKLLHPIIPEINKTNKVEDQTPSSLYQEIAYGAAEVDGAMSYINSTGHAGTLIAGINNDSVVPVDGQGLTYDAKPSAQLPIDGCAEPGTHNAKCPTDVQPPGVTP